MDSTSLHKSKHINTAKMTNVFFGEQWTTSWDSNPQQTAYEADVVPTYYHGNSAGSAKSRQYKTRVTSLT